VVRVALGESVREAQAVDEADAAPVRVIDGLLEDVWQGEDEGLTERLREGEAEWLGEGVPVLDTREDRETEGETVDDRQRLDVLLPVMLREDDPDGLVDGEVERVAESDSDKELDADTDAERRGDKLLLGDTDSDRDMAGVWLVVMLPLPERDTVTEPHADSDPVVDTDTVHDRVAVLLTDTDPVRDGELVDDREMTGVRLVHGLAVVDAVARHVSVPFEDTDGELESDGEPLEEPEALGQ